MVGIASNIRHIIKESTQNWKTMKTANRRAVGEVRIRRGTDDFRLTVSYYCCFA